MELRFRHGPVGIELRFLLDAFRLLKHQLDQLGKGNRVDRAVSARALDRSGERLAVMAGVREVADQGCLVAELVPGSS